MRRSFVTLLAVAAAVAGCLPGYIAPTPIPAREPTRVAASFDSTWSAVVSYLAASRFEIKTIDKASGIVVAEAVRALLLDNRPYDRRAKGPLPARYAECGTYKGVLLEPDYMGVNVRVLGDASQSTVRINARFATHYLEGKTRVEAECASVGARERALEDSVKKTVERKAVSR